MNSKETTPPATKGNEQPKAPKPRRSGGVFGAFCWLATVGAVGAGGYFIWKEVEGLNTTLTDESRELDEFIDGQEQRNALLNTGIDDLRSSMKVAESTSQRIADSVSGLSTQISDLDAGFDAKITRLTDEQQAFRTAVDSLKKMAAAHGESIGAMEGRVADNRKAIDRVEQDASEQLAALMDGFSGQQMRIEGLESSHATVDEAITAANGLIAQLEERFAGVQGELAGMREGFGAQQAQISELASAFAEVQSELAAVRAVVPSEPVVVLEAPVEAVVDELVIDEAPVTEETVASEAAGEEPFEDPAAPSEVEPLASELVVEPFEAIVESDVEVSPEAIFIEELVAEEIPVPGEGAAAVVPAPELTGPAETAASPAE